MAKGGFRIIDSDMHIMEPPDLWQRYTDKKYRDYAQVGVLSENVRDLRTTHPDGTPWGTTTGVRTNNPNQSGGHNYERNQKLYESHAARGWSTEVQLEAMDVEGLDIAVLFPTRGLHTLAEPFMDPPFAAAIARAYNDWMYDFCAPAPDRLFGAAMISPFDVEDAVTEVERAVNELGFRSIFMRSNQMTDKTWHDPYYDPLWSVLEELDIPIGFHESSSSGARQVGQHFEPNFMLRRVFAQPVEQMMALASFCGGGVLERHPKLRAAFLEANCAWAPWLLWRLDEAYEREADIFVPELKIAPTEYFKRQCWISIEPDEEPAKYAIDWVGSDRMVFSTDYPHGDSKYPDAVSSFLELGISDEDKKKILWDNCASLYNLAEVPANV
ncbi:MAG: amidohydrolase family protein [Chloroflexi bacterium]|nr:amidohydrolase family protein [Chloroflexota bacterium]